MQIIKVLIPKVGLFPLDYKVSKKIPLKIGDLIVVPFRNKEITGIVWELSCKYSDKKLKSINTETIFPASIDQDKINLIKRTSDYYLADLGTIAKLVLPVDLNETPIIIKKQEIPNNFNLPPLSYEQREALNKITSSDKPILIKGVTGSGKTEVYFHAIADCLKQGKQALVMLPEIALSSQIVNRFIERFGFEPVIWNSSITRAQKKKTLRGIISGDISIVIGARSSLFLPYKKLALIVIDEEHDPSYKQGEGILYNARDMAILRSFIAGNKIVLISATPSIETLHNIDLGKYQLIELKNRFSNAILPNIKIIDMRNEQLKHNSWLSQDLIAAVNLNLSKKEQTLLFLNRRGYAPLMLCKSCGYRFTCNSCSASMVVHKSSKRLECHHCGAVSRIHTNCPKCGEVGSLRLCGPGIERIAEQASSLFPNSKIAVMSKDHSTTKEEMQFFLSKMEKGEIDILIGTQIITKGYHFPKLTLVGVIDADLGFIGGDLRASERTYQLLHQVGGRAGREDKKGTVLLQTYNPENSVLLALKNGQEDAFIKTEISTRKTAGMPPFTKMASITLTGRNPEKTLSLAKNLITKAPKSQARILGPAEALMLKVSGHYRYRILVITDRQFNLQKYIKLWIENIKIPSSLKLKIDIDPYNFF